MSPSESLHRSDTRALFDLTGRVAFITGGAGLLGQMHAEAVLEAGGTAVFADIDGDAAEASAAAVCARWRHRAFGVQVDVTSPESVQQAHARVLTRVGYVDILINNAARNPKMETPESGMAWASRVEHLSLETWNAEIAVGLTGAFLCSQVVGGHMAAHGGGVIVNIASDLGVIAPDQRIYRRPGVVEGRQPVKPASYSVVKGGLVVLTKYLATYWAEQNVRVNSLSPGGIANGQPDDFVSSLSRLIPLGRMAERHEYKGAVVFLCSEASSYMTGANLIVDGGRTCW